MDASIFNFVFDTDSSPGHIVGRRPRDPKEPIHALIRMISAISDNRPLSEILRIARDGVLETGLFDRAAVFLFDRMRSAMIGVWGTDRNGQPKDISDLWYEITPATHSPAAQVLRGEMDYYLTNDFTADTPVPPSDPMAGVRAHAVVPIRSGDNILGLFCVDNLLRNVAIGHAGIEAIRPFADQAALAIHNIRQQEAIMAAHIAVRHSEAMRIIGSTASGILHNVRNKLFAIQGYAEMIKESEGATSDICHYARIIELATMDAEAITVRMRRQYDEEGNSSGFPYQAVDIGLVIQQAIDLSRPIWKNMALGRGIEIEIVKEITPNLYTHCVPSEIREVLVNLIKNACEAMPIDGRIRVSCAPEQTQETALQVPFMPIREGEPMLALKVSDTGTGMTFETTQKIFEPFFTTKGGLKGTGLGLSVSREIIERHRGRIGVESTPGAGTTFTILLPMTTPDAAIQKRDVHSGSLQGRTLLLVEDEEVALTCLDRILKGYGATTHFAQNALEALQWLDQNADTCDMVLSGQAMAGSTGLQFLAQVERKFPHLRRVLLSGWISDYPPQDDIQAAEIILPKPIRPRNLVSALLALLEQPEAV